MTTQRRLPGSTHRSMSNDDIQQQCELILGWILVAREEAGNVNIPNPLFAKIAMFGEKGMDFGDLEIAVMMMAQLAEGILNYVTNADDLSQILGETPRGLYSQIMLNSAMIRSLMETPDDDDDDGLSGV